ncbi:hypothetical protein SAY86_017361 [Trapa natans]|uniref:Uncharacterized protein n=1 Tax=Trapa natans TaxID=22666 RepID=A0AAN7M1E9_TRANT|nr:hypothetical protein SAY86_017361 [Trapa natans]
MWEFCSLNKLWDGEPSEKVQMPFVPSESDGIPKVANEGSRLDIPEGPLGSLIAGISTGREEEDRKRKIGRGRSEEG